MNGWAYEAVGSMQIETNGKLHIRKTVSGTYRYALINTSYFTN